MKKENIRIVRLRLNPERNIWDKQILGWLATIPLGYRAKAMKEALIKVITKDQTLSRTAPLKQDTPELNLQLDTLFKDMEP